MGPAWLRAITVMIVAAALAVSACTPSPPAPPQRAVEQVTHQPVSQSPPAPSTSTEPPACLATLMMPDDPVPIVGVREGARIAAYLHCVGVDSPPTTAVVRAEQAGASRVLMLMPAEPYFDGSVYYVGVTTAGPPGDWVYRFDLSGVTVARVPLRVVAAPTAPGQPAPDPAGPRQ